MTKLTLEQMKKKAEYMKVKAAEAELELRIAVTIEELERLEKALVIQSEAANKLELQIK